MAEDTSNMIDKPWIAQGKTVFYGQSTFDPNQFMQNAAALKVQQQAQQAKAAIARQAAWKDFKWEKYNPTKVYEVNRQQVEEKLEELGDIAVNAYAAGMSPNDPNFMKEFSKVRAALLELENEGETYQKAFNAITSEVQKNAGEYDPDMIASWIEEMEKLPTVQEKNKYMRENNPLEKPVDIRADLLEIDWPTYTETKRQANPNYFVEQSGLLEEETSSGVYDYVLNNPKYKNQLARDLKKAKETNPEATIDDVIKPYQEFVLGMGERKYEESGTIPRSGGNGSGYKTAIAYEPFTKTEVKELPSNQSLVSGENAIAIKTKGGATYQPIQLTNKGKTESYVPLEIVVVEEEGKKFKMIRAQKANATTTKKIKEGESEESFLAGIKKEYGDNAKVEEQEDGEYKVTYISPDTELIPWTDENKVRFPQEFSEYVDKWYDKRFKSTSGSSSGAGINTSKYN